MMQFNLACRYTTDQTRQLLTTAASLTVLDAVLSRALGPGNPDAMAAPLPARPAVQFEAPAETVVDRTNVVDLRIERARRFEAAGRAFATVKADA